MTTAHLAYVKPGTTDGTVPGYVVPWLVVIAVLLVAAIWWRMRQDRK